VGRVIKLVEMALNDGENFNAAIGVGLQAILASPHFLFRVELDPEPNNPDAIRTINDYELATRLSYFLWSSMPDDELFTLARLGLLRKWDNLDRQVRRMLADPKAQALAEIKLDLAILKYARFACGGRFAPSKISELFDQTPQLRDPKLVLSDIEATDAPDAYLRSLHPKHEQFARLRQALQDEVDARNGERFARANHDFRSALLELCGNKRLADTARRFDGQIQPLRRATLADAGSRAVVVRHHRRLVAAIARGEPREAQSVMQALMALARQATLELAEAQRAQA